MRVKCKRNNFYFMVFISFSVIGQYWVHKPLYEPSLLLTLQLQVRPPRKKNDGDEISVAD